MIIIERDNLERVVFQIVFENSGAIFAKEGVVNFLAQMLKKRGTLKTPETKFAQKLDENGISLGVSAGRETLSIQLIFLKSKQRIALKLLRELLLYPNFTESAFEKTKKEILASIAKKKSDYDYISAINLNKITFKGTPLAYPIEGEKIEFTLDEVIAHHKNFFIKENMSFIIGGDFNEIDTSKFVKLFPSGKKREIPFFTPQQGKIVEKRETTQSYIYFNAPFNVKKEERYKAKVATFILGAGGFGSRIIEEIRVKQGLAYSAYAYNSFTNHSSLLKGHLQTKIENETFAIEKLKEIITQFTKHGITQEELTEAKNFIIGSEPLRNEVLIQRLLRKFNEYYEGYEEGHYKKELQLIEKLSLEELNEFIKSHTEIEKLSFSIVTK